MRVDHDRDVVVVDVEQEVGFDGLESFVHERGRVDGDLGTHGPARMRERFLHGHPAHL